jgi:SAM-dependent methyltransferase
MSEYRTLFDVRGARYNDANRRFPEARIEEAERMLAHLELGAGARWLDVGAGGGFLGERASVAEAGRVAYGCDESAVFLADASSYGLRIAAEYERLPFADRSFAGAACLAALHHVEDPGRVLAEMLRVTAAGGRVAIGDVTAGSRVARFLNEFVDSHTDTGHAGRFFEADGLAELFRAAGGSDVRGAAEEIQWTFASRGDAHVFCRELFGLRSDADDIDLAGALGYLGLSESGGRWVLPWAMVFVSAAA